MRLMDFLNLIDEIDDIIIWFDDDMEADSPAYKGSILHVPYCLLKYKLAEGGDDKPVCLVHYENEYGHDMVAYHVVLKDEECF